MNELRELRRDATLSQRSLADLLAPRSSDRRFEGGISRKVGPGDVIVIPPGTVHQWTAVDGPQTLAYFIARIDPQHKQASGALNDALKKGR